MRYFRITCYNKKENITYIFDSYGVFRSLKKFIQVFKKDDLRVLYASSEKNTIDTNCRKVSKDNNEIILTGLEKGKPKLIIYEENGIKFKAIKVGSSIHIIKKRKNIKGDKMKKELNSLYCKNENLNYTQTNVTFKKYDDIKNILPANELFYYITTFLIDNKDFIMDMDKCLCNGTMKNMNKEEKLNYFKCNIGNEARTYLMKILVLKHLSKILLKNISGFTDEFWQAQLKKIDL